MNEIKTALRVTLWSARNSARHDARWRMGALVALGLDLIIAIASINGLAVRVVQWQEAGAAVLQSQLWILFLSAWGGIGLVTLLGGLQLGFRNNILRLLVTQPLSPASLFHLQYVWLLAGNGNWLLLALAIFSVAFILALGIAAWIWIVLLAAGELLAAWAGLILPLLFVRIVVPHRNAALFLLAAAGVGLTVVGRFVGSQQLAVTIPRAYTALPPVPGILVLIVLLFVVLGPLADLSGRLHIRAFEILESRRGGRTATQVPGIGIAARWLSSYRTLTGALFVKGLESQSRNPLLWARLVALIAYYAVFPFVRTYLIPYHVSDLLFVVAYASGLSVLMVADTAPSPVGGEGNRLALYLIAPLKPLEILRAKWIILLAPAVLLGLAVTLTLSLSLALAAGETAFACMSVSLIVIGSTAVVVGGSVWDADLNQSVEGAMQAFLQEEAPITPQRLLTVALSLLFLAIAFGLVRVLPADSSVPVLILLDVLIVVGVGYVARARLLQLGRS